MLTVTVNPHGEISWAAIVFVGVVVCLITGIHIVAVNQLYLIGLWPQHSVAHVQDLLEGRNPGASFRCERGTNGWQFVCDAVYPERAGVPVRRLKHGVLSSAFDPVVRLIDIPIDLPIPIPDPYLLPSDCKPEFAPINAGTRSEAAKARSWKKNEAAGWNGKGWIGWSWNGDSIRSVRLKVRDRSTHSLQDDHAITIESTPEVTFAVRCIRGLTPGSIRNAGVSAHDLSASGPLTIPLGRWRYQLWVETRLGNRSFADVVVSDGRRTQVLYSTDGFVADPRFTVEWAGDLDRDGRLDLIVNLSRTSRVHVYRLLLSTRASATRFMGEVAVFETGN